MNIGEGRFEHNIRSFIDITILNKTERTSKADLTRLNTECKVRLLMRNLILNILAE